MVSEGHFANRVLLNIKGTSRNINCVLVPCLFWSLQTATKVLPNGMFARNSRKKHEERKPKLKFCLFTINSKISGLKRVLFRYANTRAENVMFTSLFGTFLLRPSSSTGHHSAREQRFWWWRTRLKGNRPLLPRN